MNIYLYIFFHSQFIDVLLNMPRHETDKERAVDRESRNSCDTNITTLVKNELALLGQDDQCNRKNEKEATQEQEKLFIRPPSVQSLPTLSSTTSNSSITSFVASNQTFTSSLSSSQRLQGEQS